MWQIQRDVLAIVQYDFPDPYEECEACTLISECISFMNVFHLCVGCILNVKGADRVLVGFGNSFMFK